MTIRPTDPPLRWAVKSASRPLEHLVELIPGGGICSCEDHQYRGGRCRHIEAVREYVLDLTITNHLHEQSQR